MITRDFNLVVLDARDKVVDRIHLELVSNPKGLGFAVEYSKISTDIDDILTTIKQKFEPVTLEINFLEGREYQKMEVLRRWIERNFLLNTALEWSSPNGVRYKEVIVEKFPFSEIAQNQIVMIPMILQPLTPFFIIEENVINILPSTTGKIYPYQYPYTYGKGIITNNIITNNYISSIPLNITLYGAMINPSVSIRHADNSNFYSTVSFPSLVLDDGMWITINAASLSGKRTVSSRRKITFFNGQVEVDGYNYIDATKQSFIFAEIGTSEIYAPIQSDKTGKLEASFRRYML